MSSQSAFQTRTLADLARILSDQNGDAVALWSGGKSLSFRELDQRANQVAHALLAAPNRKHVAVLGRDSAESLIILFGAAKARMAVTFVNYRLTVSEMRFILEDCEPSHGFIEASQAGPARELQASGVLSGVTCVSFGGLPSLGPALGAFLRDLPTSAPKFGPEPEDPAVLLYTSGTTGRPKGVQLAHRGFLAIRRELERAREDYWGLSNQDVALHTLPLFHIGGLWWAVNMLSAGASLVMLREFDPDVALELIEAHQVTAACFVPAMLELMLRRQEKAQRDLRSMRTIAYGGAPIAPSLLDRAQRTFKCNLMQFYGLTETGNTAVCLRAEDHRDLGPRVAAAGRPYPGVRLRCVNRQGEDCACGEIGEIWIHSPANMLGYWKRPEETEKALRNGWIATGDAGYLDESGYLYICDRIKDMIISAGENIYPAEIEAAIGAHPAVKEVAVIGVPDERWGEAVKAIVVRSGPLEPKHLLQFLRGKIAEFKFPRSIDIVDALPRTPSGKLKKHELRAPYWAGRSRQVN